MTEREKLQYCYELAFYPPRLHTLWADISAGRIDNMEETGALLDTALLLHQALPRGGYASQRALNRLALYQAKARAFGMVSFIENVRRFLGREPLSDHTIPPGMVRDIGIPKICRQHPSP